MKPKKNSKRVIYVGGTWDLFHAGHLSLLKSSFGEGDHLVVGVSTDELVESLKKSAPIMSYQERANIIASISFVDEVTPQHELNDIKNLEAYDVNAVTMGANWKGREVPNYDFIIENKIDIITLEYNTELSPAKIKEKINNGWEEDK